jgi:predicted dienelactone hydrolase
MFRSKISQSEISLFFCSILVLISMSAELVISTPCARAEEVHQSATKAGAENSKVIYQDWTLAGKAPYPTVIFSHGLGGSREAAGYLGEYLARQGYLCIFVQHPGSDASVWEPYKNQGMKAIREHLKTSANPENLINRAGDISFVIDE